MPYADSVYNPDVAVELLLASLDRCLELLSCIAEDGSSLRSHEGFLDVVKQVGDATKHARERIKYVRTAD